MKTPNPTAQAKVLNGIQSQEPSTEECFGNTLDTLVAKAIKDNPDAADSLTTLRTKIVEAYEYHSKKDIEPVEARLQKATEQLVLFEQDVTVLKNTILRMAISQYGV